MLIKTPGGGRVEYGHHLSSNVGRLGVSRSALWCGGSVSGESILAAAGKYRLGGLDAGGDGSSRYRGKGDDAGVEDAERGRPGISILGRR